MQTEKTKKQIHDISDKEKADIGALAQCVVGLLKERGMTVTAAESCTGGMVSAALTSVAGSSEVLKCSFVTYCDKAKRRILGVRQKTLEKHTAVSRQTAKEMAQGGAKRAKADCCISVTGYAGPDSGYGDPVGLVYIGCHVKGKTKVKKFLFEGDRNSVREQAVRQALLLLKKKIQ